MDARTTTSLSDSVGASSPRRRRFALSPINRRRWQNFKANRRGYVSFWLFLVLFFVSLFAEFLANDKPLYIHLNGKSFFPVLVSYPDTDFSTSPDDDVIGTAADYRSEEREPLD